MAGFDAVTKGFWKDMERGVALFIKQHGRDRTSHAPKAFGT